MTDSKTQRQAIGLAGVFQAAAQVQQLATTGLLDQAPYATSIQSILVTNPENDSDIYGGHLDNLKMGGRLLHQFVRRERGIDPLILNYSMSIIMLQHRLSKEPTMLTAIGQRLEQIQHQAEHFGPTHENVIAALSGLYQDTLSTLSFRIQVKGEPSILQQSANADKIRALLLAGIRSSMLWHQAGGRRWKLLFSRKQIMRDLTQLGL